MVEASLRTLHPVKSHYVAKQLREMAADLQIDVINAHSPQGHLLAVLGRVPAPVVRTRCDDRPVQRNIANHWLYGKCAAAVILPSESNRRRLLESIPSAGDHAEVVYCGLDLQGYAASGIKPVLRDKLGLAQNAVIVGNLGRFSPEKGPLHFLDTAAQVARACPEAYFVMSGLTVQHTPEELTKAGIERGLNGRLSILPPFEDARQALGDFDIGVITSQYSESNCRVALEYMALGIPVVSTDVNVLGELFKPNVTGLVYPKDAVAPMAEAVKRLVREPDYRKQIGEAGRAHARERYDLPVFLDKTEAILSNAVNASGGRRMS